MLKESLRIRNDIDRIEDKVTIFVHTRHPQSYATRRLV